MPRADRGTPDSTGHNGSHASIVHRPRCPRVGPTEPPDPSKHPRRGTHAVLRWGRRPALPFGIHVASGSIAVPGFHPSSSPVIMAYATPDASSFADLYGKLRLIQRQNRFFSFSGLGTWSRVAISPHVFPCRNISNISRISSR